MSESRWVTFDCFGTIVDWNAVLRAALVELFPDAAPDELVRRFHDAELAIKHDGPYRRYRDVLAASTAVVARGVGAELPDGGGAQIAERWGDATMFADAEAGLRELTRRGWRIGILTNCDDDLFAATRRRLTVAPDAVVTAERVRSYKPELVHFDTFRAEQAPTAWVHAANSWIHDVVPAARAGVPCVWVDRDRSGHDPARASARIEDFAGLADAVDGVAG